MLDALSRAGVEPEGVPLVGAGFVRGVHLLVLVGELERGAAVDVFVVVVLEELRRVESEEGLLHVERAGLHGIPRLRGPHQREFPAVDHLFGILFGQFQVARRPIYAGQHRLHGVEVQVGDAATGEAVGGVGAHRGDQLLVLGEVLFGFGEVADDLLEHLVERAVRGDFDAVALHVGNGLGLGRGVARAGRYGEEAHHFEVHEGAQGEQLALVEPDIGIYVVGFGQNVRQGLVDVPDHLVACHPDVFGDGDGVVGRPLALHGVGHRVGLRYGEVADHRLGVFEREFAAVEVLVRAHLGVDAVDGVLAAFGRRVKFLVGHLRFGIDVEVGLAAAQQREQGQQIETVFFHA